MASTYATPGVYIEEKSVLPSSVVGVATAVPAFLGFTETAEKGGDNLTMKPTKIDSFVEYERYFGGPPKETGISVDVDDTSGNREIKASITGPSDYIMNHALRMYFANGGGPCYIVSIGSSGGTGSPATSDYTDGLAAIKKEDEPTLIVMPEAALHFGVSDHGGYISILDNAISQCKSLGDRFTIMDVVDNNPNDGVSPDTISSDASTFRSGSLTNSYLKYGAAYYTYLDTTISYAYDDEDVTVNHTPASGETDHSGALDTVEAADLEMYNQVTSAIKAQLKATLPPSGAVAGVYARVDGNRGVWKAPANVSVSSVNGPHAKITHEKQEGLNVDATSGKSINAIRSFTGKGTLVWGARTLAGNDNEWRYVPVRRFFIYAEESIKKATEFVVFEPNDANTWVRVKTMISNFLT